MAKIHVLDHQTIDQIAAGEVVERPASVVKELVENAMDAGADAVTVEIKDGGTSLIRVTDNGGGIEKSQVDNAFLRHATSKISSAKDLTKLVSLGFRPDPVMGWRAAGRKNRRRWGRPRGPPSSCVICSIIHYLVRSF